MNADSAAAEAAGKVLAQALDAGKSTSDAINSLVQTLKADPKVIATSANMDGRSAWALFESGIEYIYDVIDEDDEDQALQQASQVTTKNIAALKSSVLGIGKENALRVTNAQLGSLLTYVMPGNNKAVLANSLYKTHPLRDVRLALKKMLETCGYEVQMVDADLEFFKSMSKYGVIFIEAHGSIRNSVEQLQDSAIETYYSNLDQTHEYCGLKGAEAVLQTSIQVTKDITAQYKQDLECGRLKIRSPTILRKGLPAITYHFYAVTPNFVRQYDKGTFPANALMCLNACRTFDASDTSAWATLMYEKSNGSVVIGWNRRVRYAYSSRAMLHLFQFMAGTNQTFDISAIDPKTGVKTIWPLLFKTDAPVLPQTVNMAMDALTAKKFDYDPKKGAQLIGSGDTLYGNNQLILAPAIEQFETLGDGKARLVGRCQDNADLRFGLDDVVNIGASTLGEWKFSLPARYSGMMSLHQLNRKCPPRDLLRWDPIIIKVRPASTTNALGTCDSSVTYQLSARAIAAGDRFGRSVWDKPDYAFSAGWDPDASKVTWSVTGNATETGLFGTSSCSWSGGTSRNFNDASSQDKDTGEFVSYDGKTAWLTVDPPFDLEYTVTCSGLSPPSYACGVYSSVNVQVQLRDDWSIMSGSSTDLLGLYVVEWQFCQPQPIFDSDYLPR